MSTIIEKEYAEKKAKAAKGWPMLFFILLLAAVFLAAAIWGTIIIYGYPEGQEPLHGILLLVGGIVLFVLILMMLAMGLKIVNPNEALVLILFGKYIGTVADDGFYYVNPFAVKKRISLKARTLNNEKQKVNDQDGNPIEIGVIVIWKIINTARALFKVEDYTTFISTQTDSAIRHVARLYPYDVSEEGDEKSLRGSANEISEVLKKELQTRVELSGIEIVEARISHLAYAPEIAAAMLQRQQATAIVVARQKIVEGAVGMVEMALAKLSEKNIVKLDDERKAAMVSNLLVVLCGNKDAQPIVNSGSIY